MAKKKYINTKDVVRLTGLSTNEVYALIHEGKLKAHKAPKSGWRIEESLVYEMFPDCKAESVQDVTSALPEAEPRKELITQFISDREHYDFLINNIKAAKSSVYISTANLKRFSLGDTEARATCESFLDVLDSLAESGIEVKIICSSPSRGFLEDMSGHERLMENPCFQFKTCRRCHMKMVIIDNSIIYVGSANITAAGMGPRINTRRNFEAGIITSDVNLVEEGIDIFEEAWSERTCKRCYYKADCKQ